MEEPAVSDNQETLDRIREVVTTHPVVLFMKGSPTFPQCGFSAQAVQVLEGYGIEFKAVDVLSDPLVRQGVKEYSNWPTVPQLYVGGEFVGGSDILVEMHQSGELAPLLQKAGVGQPEADR
ncbi:MAG: Grx4 family monothiol glutaredoxin [Myxococcota bacterium]